MPTNPFMWAVSDDSASGTNLTTLLARANTALSNNQAYLAIGAPTQAQAVTQVGALTRQIDALIRLATAQLGSIADS